MYSCPSKMKEGASSNLLKGNSELVLTTSYELDQIIFQGRAFHRDHREPPRFSLLGNVRSS